MPGIRETVNISNFAKDGKGRVVPDAGNRGQKLDFGVYSGLGIDLVVCPLDLFLEEIEEPKIPFNVISIYRTQLQRGKPLHASSAKEVAEVMVQTIFGKNSMNFVLYLSAYSYQAGSVTEELPEFPDLLGWDVRFRDQVRSQQVSQGGGINFICFYPGGGNSLSAKGVSHADLVCHTLKEVIDIIPVTGSFYDHLAAVAIPIDYLCQSPRLIGDFPRLNTVLSLSIAVYTLYFL